MNYEERIEGILGQKFYENNDIDKICEFIKSQDRSLTLKKKGIEMLELRKYLKGLIDLDFEVKCENDTVNFLYDFAEFKKRIGESISPTISELNIPGTFLNSNFEFLSRLRNLSKLRINDYKSLSLDVMDYIEKNTNISEITMSYLSSEVKDGEKYFYINVDGEEINLYGNISLIEEKPKVFDVDNNSFEEEKKDKKYDRNVNAKIGALTSENIRRIFDSFKEDMKSIDRAINIECGKSVYNLNIKDGVVDLSVRDENLDNISMLYEELESYGLNVNHIAFYLRPNSNEKINYIDRDYKALDEISKKTSISVLDGVGLMQWDNFRGLVESMKWYREIISEYPLSPVEKLAFAYDILKTFEYNESSVDVSESRHPDLIINTGHIVCSGYTNMLKEIFRDLDPNVLVGSFGVTCYEKDNVTKRGGHSRAIVYVNDEKYGIKGAYALDPTWDSVMENGTEKIDRDYNALDLYKYFMIPFSDYNKVFPHDSNVNFFRGDINYLNENLSEQNIDKAISSVNTMEEISKGKRNSFLPQSFNTTGLFASDINDSFGSKGYNFILNMFKSKRVPKDKMMEIIRNVRMAEGYGKELIDAEMEKVSRIYDKTNISVDQLTGKLL